MCKQSPHWSSGVHFRSATVTTLYGLYPNRLQSTVKSKLDLQMHLVHIFKFKEAKVVSLYISIYYCKIESLCTLLTNRLHTFSWIIINKWSRHQASCPCKPTIMCPWVFPIQWLVLWHNINHETQQTFIILVWGNIQPAHSRQADWCSSVQWMQFPFNCWNKQLYDGYCRITFLYKKVQHSSITWDSHSMNSDIMFFLSLCYFHFIFIIHSECYWCYQATRPL